MTAVAIIALVVAAVAAAFAGLAWGAANRSAKVAESVDHRARTPQLAIQLSHPAPAPGDRVIYRVRNDGPQDLDSLVVYGPRPPGGGEYQVAVTGGGVGWSDAIDLGPAPLGQERSFTLSCGGAVELPEFRVRIECAADADGWESSELLPDPRGSEL